MGLGERRASVPGWVVGVAIVLILVGFCCSRQIGEAIHAAGFLADGDLTDAQGHPLDWAGDRLPHKTCPQGDGGILVWQAGYRYRCEQCGRTVEMRISPDDGRVEVRE